MEFEPREAATRDDIRVWVRDWVGVGIARSCSIELGDERRRKPPESLWSYGIVVIRRRSAMKYALRPLSGV
ncbi:MAG: hypothetical protein ACR2RB_08420, partial [Gammaproteobacteria bacterium]